MFYCREGEMNRGSRLSSKGYERARAQIHATKQARSDLESLEKEEKVESQQIKQDKERELLPGELDWKIYLIPQDKTNLEECKRIDLYNEGSFQANNHALPRINDLLDRLGIARKKSEPPARYYATAKMEWEKMLFDANFRIMRAVEYLFERQKIAIQHYALVDGPALADDMAEQEEIGRIIEESGQEGIDITDAVGGGHAKNCTCENLWDGKAERCFGQGARIKWKRLNGHHFLRPRVAPESY